MCGQHAVSILLEGGRVLDPEEQLTIYQMAVYILVEEELGFCFINELLSLLVSGTNWHLPSTSVRIKSCAAETVTFNMS